MPDAWMQCNSIKSDCTFFKDGNRREKMKNFFYEHPGIQKVPEGIV